MCLQFGVWVESLVSEKDGLGCKGREKQVSEAVMDLEKDPWLLSEKGTERLPFMARESK